MTQEEKNDLLQLIFTMRNRTIEKEAISQFENKEKIILERLKYEISGFEKVMRTNNIEAERQKRKGSESWQMFHEGKVDAYGLIISVLKDIIKEYE